jgi:CheY-like chemotaxis protein
MITPNPATPLILILEEVEEIRDGIESLLAVTGYRVEPARAEPDAILKAKQQSPDLILISPGDSSADLLRKAYRIRQQANLPKTVPVVNFCCEEVAEGEEVNLGNNVYLAHLANFDQLRAFLRQLLF